jgi:uncharacterized phage-associated protein
MTDNTAIDVAKYLLVKAHHDGELITNLKMQKLLYYAQAWHLVNFKTPLFCDTIQAWKYGPIVENAYHRFKKFRYSPIVCKDAEGVIAKIPVKTQKYLDAFYVAYINYSASDLTQMSHNDEPWKNSVGKSDCTIPNKTILEYYTEKYERSRDQKTKKSV